MLISFGLGAQEFVTMGTVRCPRGGSEKVGSHKYKQNELKNRDVPKHYAVNTEYTLAKLVSMQKAEVPENIDPTTVVVIEGFLIDTKRGGKNGIGSESCICGVTDEQFFDTHMVIGETQDAIGANCLIAEVTIRVRNQIGKSHDYSYEGLKDLKGRKIRITGYLFCDKEHWGNSTADDGKSKLWRGSTWEVHPVWLVEVWDEKKKVYISM